MFTAHDSILQQVEVTYAYDDSFIECMIDNECLSDVSTFFQCLLETCSQNVRSVEDYQMLKNESEK